MAIYLDSADIQKAEETVTYGWLMGITTNPSLLAQSKYHPEETLQRLSRLGVNEVYYQVSSSNLDKMTTEMEKARKILGQKLVVKIPPTEIGFCFASSIEKTQKKCITAIYSPSQALVAKEIGATYVAVYVNRATRLIGDGIKVMQSIAQILKGSSTEIIAASIKSTDEAINAYNAGAQHLALPYNILAALTENPYSSQAVAEFQKSGAFLE